MHIAKRASVQPSRPRQLKPCVGSPPSSLLCRCIVDDESFVRIERSMRRIFFISFSLSNYQFVDFLRCLHRSSYGYGIKFCEVLSLNLCFLVG
jgi:hypothetical protein